MMPSLSLGSWTVQNFLKKLVKLITAFRSVSESLSPATYPQDGIYSFSYRPRNNCKTISCDLKLTKYKLVSEIALCDCKILKIKDLSSKKHFLLNI